MKNLLVLIIVGFGLSANGQSKWESLNTLDKWHIYNHADEPMSAKWKKEKKCLIFDPEGESNYKINDLVSNKEYENFELKLEWKIEEGGNSGLFFAIHESDEYSTPYLTSPEIQILDDENHPDSNAGKNGNRKAGSLYDMIPSSSKAFVAEEWNLVTIIKKDNHITVTQNRQPAVEFQVGDQKWKDMVANSKFKTWKGFGEFSKGKIGLQDHGNKVAFKNIYIREL